MYYERKGEKTIKFIKGNNLQSEIPAPNKKKFQKIEKMMSISHFIKKRKMVTTRSMMNNTRPITRSQTGKLANFAELQPKKRVKRTKRSAPIPVQSENFVLSIKNPDDLESIDSEISTIPPPPPSNRDTYIAYTPDYFIDFDDAHDEWEANKKKLANGMYAYLCMKPLKNGKKCKRVCCDTIGFYSGCKQHYAWEEKENQCII